MITLEAPHMALNSADTWSTAQMWRSHLIEVPNSVQRMLGLVIANARATPRGILKHLVFSCHGTPGRLWIGTGLSGHGIRRGDINSFRSIRGKVEKIWLHACSVAGRNSLNQRVGNDFCAGIARAANCHVVASTQVQVGATYGGVVRTLPYGQLDTFEGLVLSYDQSGAVTWSHRYRSGIAGRSGDRTIYRQNPD